MSELMEARLRELEAELEKLKHKRLVEYTTFEGRTRRWECWRSDWELVSDEERFNLALAAQALEDALQREMAHGLGDTIARKVVLEVLSVGRSEDAKENPSRDLSRERRTG